MGAAATTATAVGPWRERDVEYDRSCLGIVERQDLDPALTARYSTRIASAGPIQRLSNHS